MNIIPFDSGKISQSITSMFGDTANDLVGNSAGGGFPVISIKGKVFHIQRGDERVMVTKPGEDDPAASIEVVIIRANPDRSKVFYATGYQEGEALKPTCYSNNGTAPEADAQEPQAKKCAVCPHNQWGSRITDNGGKGKACSDSRRLAIATLDAPADPMLLRVPAASMKALEEFGKQLAARGVPAQAVVTKIGFDYTVAHPALTFKPVGLIGDAALLNEIKAVGQGEIASQIIGIKPASDANAVEQAAEEPLPVIAAPAKAPPAAEPKPAPAKASRSAKAESAIDAASQIGESQPKATVKVETPAPAAKSAAPSIEESIEGMLDSLDFDD
jgi:hypothetical protein